MERLIGNLWIVRGDLAELYDPTGLSLVVVPGYTNRAVHPVADAMANRFPVLRRRLYRRYDQPYITSGMIRTERLGDTILVLTASMFYSSHSSVHRLPECPPEREWWQINRAAVAHGAGSIHWQETENPDMVDTVGTLFRLFFEFINGSRFKFVYYNPGWPWRESVKIV